MAEAAPDFLGRVLDGAGAPAGTCFQMTPGVLVTAWHVLSRAGAGDVGDEVTVEPLAEGGALPGGGGAPAPAVVHAVDDVRDLAVLRSSVALPGSVAGVVKSGAVPAHAPVTITGVPEFVDRHDYRFTHAVGRWLGTAWRGDGVARGQVEAAAVVPGMSGAPVRLSADNRVVGVLSARYNSADEWMRHTVWAVCTEDLTALLAQGADGADAAACRLPPGTGRRPDGVDGCGGPGNRGPPGPRATRSRRRGTVSVGERPYRSSRLCFRPRTSATVSGG